MWKQLLGDPAGRQLRRFNPLIAEINGLEPTLEAFSDDELRQLTAEYLKQLGPPEKVNPGSA
jgi:preprotein translocase subunit SecA